MHAFHLPDLGEGLKHAEVVQWHVKPGDHIDCDQLLLSVETDKAVVDIPSPQSGRIESLFAEVGERVPVGSPLMAFDSGTAETEDSAEISATAATPTTKSNAATVVGTLSATSNTNMEHLTTRQAASGTTPWLDNGSRVVALATPKVRQLARQLGVDLADVNGRGSHGLILAEDVSAAAQHLSGPGDELSGPRRAMYDAMTRSGAEVVPVTLTDVADISHWQKQDTTIRICQAMIVACQQVPIINSWFHGKQQRLEQKNDIHLGIAVDSHQGLLVPVIHDAGSKTAEALRAELETLRQQVHDRTIPPAALRGSTITLSNFGALGGRFANPIVVPPSVAILGVGRSFEDLVLGKDGKPHKAKRLPLSLSVDHRVVTGGEAARFLTAVIEALTNC